MKNNPLSNNKIKLFFSWLLKSRLFMQNVIYIGGIMILFFLVFAFLTYKQSSNILLNEFSSSSSHQLEIIADAVDAHLQDMRYIIATMDKNNMVQAFFSYENPEALYPDYEVRLRELLTSYSISQASIDTIYLYSELNDSIITTQGTVSLSNMKDTNWAIYLTDDVMQKKLLIFPRTKNDTYPYLLCIMKPFDIDGHKAAIVLNVNLSLVPYLTNVNCNPYHEIFLISDEKEVIYSYNQRNLLEPLETFPRLTFMQERTDMHSTIISDTSEPYIITQLHSEDYPWYYVTITNLAAYNDQLSRNAALMITLLAILFVAVLIMTFLFSMRSTKPIHNLLLILKNTSTAPYNKNRSENEVHFIAEQIISYVQQNKTLSDELTKGLNLLNETKLLALQSQINPHFLFNTLNMIYSLECEELGFKHKLPQLTLNLSRLLRYAFETTDLVPLSTEINFTQKYLSLMQQRHNNRFQIIYDISHDTLNLKVPKLFIQPIIENAIFHGFSKSNKEVHFLKISAQVNDKHCIITVHDNGVGMNVQTLNNLRNITEAQNPQSTSIGLKNVIIRMRLLYGNEFSMTIDSVEEQGSTFTLSIPLLKE